jgi:hypothetical protein
MTNLEGMTPDADGKYRIEWLTGTVDASRPTGKWIAQEDGSLAMEMTDWIERDGNGVEVSRRKHEPFITMSFDHFEPPAGSSFTESELFEAAQSALRTAGPGWLGRLLRRLTQ